MGPVKQLLVRTASTGALMKRRELEGVGLTVGSYI